MVCIGVGGGGMAGAGGRAREEQMKGGRCAQRRMLGDFGVVRVALVGAGCVARTHLHHQRPDSAHRLTTGIGHPFRHPSPMTGLSAVTSMSESLSRRLMRASLAASPATRCSSKEEEASPSSATERSTAVGWCLGRGRGNGSAWRRRIGRGVGGVRGRGEAGKGGGSCE